jgi:two-component system alkaline phosphatase synthesis response regulator PhoP
MQLVPSIQDPPSRSILDMIAQLLIAESDPGLCRVYRTYLNAVGFEVETVADGLQCLDRLRLVHPDALIVDVDLPWGGGDGVLSCLDGGDRPRAVVALGSASPAELSRRLGLPETCCLQKPAHASSLLLRLATLLFGLDDASSPPVVQRS